MIPATATKIACLDYDRPVSEQWGAYSGKCPPVTDFNLDHNNLRIPSTDPSVNSMHYMVSGTCTKEDPIIGTGGISRRAEISSHVQPTDAVEGDERWYYLAIKPAADMPTPTANYFLVTQWHPKTNRSPTLSINFHNAGTVDIGEDHKLIIGPLRKGSWTDYVLHVKFSSSPLGYKKGTGWVEAWENGVQTIQKTPFAALPDKSVFIKQGIYGAQGESGKQDVWHDGMTVWMP